MVLTRSRWLVAAPGWSTRPCMRSPRSCSPGPAVWSAACAGCIMRLANRPCAVLVSVTSLITNRTEVSSTNPGACRRGLSAASLYSSWTVSNAFGIWRILRLWVYDVTARAWTTPWPAPVPRQASSATGKASAFRWSSSLGWSFRSSGQMNVRSNVATFWQNSACALRPRTDSHREPTGHCWPL